MYICVCVKQTPDSSSVYVDPINGRIDEERFVQVLNPADACALEAAVRLKEQFGGMVLALTLGPDDARGTLRAALAIGADRALQLWTPQAWAWGAFTVAHTLAAFLRSESPAPDVILCGDSAGDWSSGSVGPALAEKLELPHITGVMHLAALEGRDPPVLHVTRRLERGYRELLEAELPLLLTVTTALNEPRYPSLPAHLAALQAPIPLINPLTLPGMDEQEEAETTLILETHTPRPLPRRIAAPDSHHSAFERIGEIVAGSATGHQARLIEGSSEELARALVQFLHERGFIDHPPE